MFYVLHQDVFFLGGGGGSKFIPYEIQLIT